MPDFKEIQAGDRQISASNFNKMIKELVRQMHFEVAPPLFFSDGGSGRILGIEDAEEISIGIAADWNNTFPDMTSGSQKNRVQWPFCLIAAPYFKETDNTKAWQYSKDWESSKGSKVNAVNLFKDQWPVPGQFHILFKVAEQWYFRYVPQRKRVRIVSRDSSGSGFYVYDNVKNGGNKDVGNQYTAYASDCVQTTKGTVDYQPGTIAYVRWEPYQLGFTTQPSSQDASGSWVFCETIRWARIIRFQFSANVAPGDNDNNPTLTRWFDGRDPRENVDPNNPGGGSNGFYVVSSDTNSQGDVGWAVLDTQVEAGNTWQKLRYIGMFSDCPPTT